MKTNTKLFDNIYKLLASDRFTQKEIASIVGVSKSEVNYVKKFALLAKDNKLEEIRQQSKHHMPVAKWAIEKFQVQETPTNLSNNPTTVNDQIVIDLLTKLLSEIKETNKLLRELR